MEGGSEKELYTSMAARMSSESKKYAGEGFSPYQRTICRVPESLRNLKPSAYTPRVVSIGPLHQHHPRLDRIQDHKFRYMYTLFDRTAKSEKTREDDAGSQIQVHALLRECIAAMLEAAPRARTCYGEILKDTDVQLAKTLLVDGCFILELFDRVDKNITESNDPAFMNNLALGGIAHDLLLLENQIPFFVLQQLFQLTLQKHSNLSLTQYVVRFFRNMMIFGSEMTAERDNVRTQTSYAHILGFLHNYYQPASNGKPGGYPDAKYSATQLHRTGVKFKASERKDFVRVKFRPLGWSTSEVEKEEEEMEMRIRQVPNQAFARLQSVQVDENGRNDRISNPTSRSKWWLFQLCGSASLELPPMRIYDHTESFLRNLIAYEQCFLTVPYYITSYAFLMDTLINSKEDVELLENEGVLQNYLGASEDASELFNNLCKEILLTRFHFSDQWRQLNNYCNLYWPKHLASLRRTYFSNPWAIISLIGALILFSLTAAQTSYTIKSYEFQAQTQPTYNST